MAPPTTAAHALKLAAILRTLGVLFLLFSTALVPPLALSLIGGDGQAVNFGGAFLLAIAIGCALWLPLRRLPVAIRSRDGFAIVALLWIGVSLLGAVPFMTVLDMTFVDAFFESASGFTTTGATVIIGLDDLPRSILFYRQEIQWLGGIGVILLAIALLPMLGVGGMQLYRAETPGPFKDDRITPRIAKTARSTSIIYVAMTAACALCFWLAGMDVFDAFAHAFSTLSTGGFSTHDASLGYFDSPTIEAIAILFMLVGGINFSVHFLAWKLLQLKEYSHDTQTKAFLMIVVAVTLLTAATLLLTGVYQGPGAASRHALFHVVSVITTTGFTLTDFSLWPLALPALLMFTGFVGGSAGSTSGGIKVIRFVVLAKQVNAQMRHLVHPHSVQPIRVGNVVVSASIIDGIWGFCAIYVVVFAVLMVALMFDGVDQVTAFGAVATSLNNVGPGLGEVSVTFASTSDVTKLLCAGTMLLGRLEIFTIIVLLSPMFWRR